MILNPCLSLTSYLKICEKYKVKPILGVELPIGDIGGNMMGFLAKNNQGLSEIYELVTFSYKNKFIFSSASKFCTKNGPLCLYANNSICPGVSTIR